MSAAPLPTWPASRLGEALDALVRESGLTATPGGTPNPAERAALDSWLETAAAGLGVECEAVAVPYAECERRLRYAGPALLELPEGGFLALLDGFVLLGPDLRRYRGSAGAIRSALFSRTEAPVQAEVDRFLEDCRIPPRRRRRSRAAILRDLLSDAWSPNCWVLRTRPGENFSRLARQARLPHRLAALAATHLAEYVLWLLSWWMIGQGALQGRLDRPWLLAWALLLVTLVPFRVVTTWLQGLFAIEAGGLLKERLLYGALRLEPDEIRHQGAGQLLGRVIESDALESLALNGGFLGLVAVIELALAAAIAGAGAGGGLHALLLVLWAGFTLLLGWRYFRSYRRWCDARLWLTHDLVERMVGHRTRLAQEPREHWHDGEDQALDRYHEVSASMDRRAALLTALAPRGWLIVGILALAPAFVSGSGSTAALAVGIGGTLLAFRALQRLVAGLRSLVGAGVAWKQVAPLFHAAARPQLNGTPSPAPEGRTVIEAHELVFRYRDRGEPVLRGCNLNIVTGDRLVLEGPSGGGKSTLASLIAGLRQPESGLLLASGLDRHTLGSSGWRRVVAFAPQFHENHVLTGTFAFNLLLGRQRLLTPQDFDEAETVCGELGLGELLKRMPAGLLQLVGETGWQLSHGERSRLFIARALLQEADLVILDESFAALDPENLRLALECVAKRARAVLAIAHP